MYTTTPKKSLIRDIHFIFVNICTNMYGCTSFKSILRFATLNSVCMISDEIYEHVRSYMNAILNAEVMFQCTIIQYFTLKCTPFHFVHFILLSMHGVPLPGTRIHIFVYLREIAESIFY